MILQQRIVPQQGMDPVQAKMMMYLLPLFFTAMMLFLPAALGVYMLTNSVLGITQQLVVEKIAPRGGGKAAKGEIKVRPAAKDDGAPVRNGAFGKGKASV
jgi:YidC/Oxa1 family membrane protein insertase